MAEISDEQLAALQGAQALLLKLTQNPTAMAHLERSIKVLDPNLETSEEVATRMAKPIIEPLAAQLAETRTRLEAFETADNDRRAKAEAALHDQEFREAFGRLRQAGLTEVGEETVKKLMVERNIADPEAAFALFERQNPKPSPEQSAWEPARWNIEENAVEHNTKALFENPDRWADDMVGKVLMDERRKVDS